MDCPFGGLRFYITLDNKTSPPVTKVESMVVNISGTYHDQLNSCVYKLEEELKGAPLRDNANDNSEKETIASR